MSSAFSSFYIVRDEEIELNQLYAQAPFIRLAVAQAERPLI